MDLSHSRISTMAETDFVFDLRGIGKTYSGIPVLSDVNLKICGGDFHTLIGENGTEKSTLVKNIRGVIASSFGTMTSGAGAGNDRWAGYRRVSGLYRHQCHRTF